MNRFVKAVSLLTISLFLLSASIDVTLDRIETSPGRSQLAVYSRAGTLLTVYHGDLAKLQTVGAVNPATMPLHLRRGATTGAVNLL